VTKKLLLVDTNVISHALTPSQTAAYAELFKKLEKQYRFAVTGYTKYELLCSSSKEKQAKIHEYIAEEMLLIFLSQPLMDFSARLYNLYMAHKSTRGKVIGVGDITNAALSIIKNCPIITIDNNDYPRPFFKDRARRRVKYVSRKDREITDTIYILIPDTTNIKECFKEHGV
jgi:predicted nucleic acid-binding protein